MGDFLFLVPIALFVRAYRKMGDLLPDATQAELKELLPRLAMMVIFTVYQGWVAVEAAVSRKTVSMVIHAVCCFVLLHVVGRLAGYYFASLRRLDKDSKSRG